MAVGERGADGDAGAEQDGARGGATKSWSRCAHLGVRGAIIDHGGDGMVHHRAGVRDTAKEQIVSLPRVCVGVDLGGHRVGDVVALRAARLADLLVCTTSCGALARRPRLLTRGHRQIAVVSL